jgi:hypothetical protein
VFELLQIHQRLLGVGAAHVNVGLQLAAHRRPPGLAKQAATQLGVELMAGRVGGFAQAPDAHHRW